MGPEWGYLPCCAVGLALLTQNASSVLAILFIYLRFY